MEETDKILKKVLKQLCWTYGNRLRINGNNLYCIYILLSAFLIAL